MVVAEVAHVEAVHGTGVGDGDGDGARAAEAAGFEGGDHGVTQQRRIDAGGEARAHIDLDYVADWLLSDWHESRFGLSQLR